MSNTNDMAPHAAIVQIHWEIHEKKQDGSYYGGTKDSGKYVLVLEGNDFALTKEYVSALVELIKKDGKNVNKFEINEERLGQTRIQGSGRLRDDNSKMLSMRGRIGKDSTG